MRKVENLVIGAGPAGYTVAIRLAQLGKEVLVVDHDKVGGTCLNYGCIPTKALLSATEIIEKTRISARFGITLGGPSVDIDKLRSWKNLVVQRLVKGVEFLLNKNGAEYKRGTVKFLAPKRLLFQGDEEFEIEACNVIIATGSKPFELKELPFDGEKVITSKEALEIPTIPQDLVIIGGGVIGLEMAEIYRRLGSRITIVELMDNVLPGTDLEVVSVITRVLTKNGVKVHTGSMAKGLIERNGEIFVKVENKNGESFEVRADLVLVSVGRRPNADELGLDKAGVECDRKGFIKTDSRMKTNIEGIYAIGDVHGGPLLAHKAHKEALIAAEVIAGHNVEWDYRAMPAAIFTAPEIATVGKTEEELKNEGIEYDVGKFPFRASGRALAMEETEGFVKILADKNGKVLGAHIIGPHASELLNELTLAVEEGISCERIGRCIHPHPTLSEAIMEAAESIYGKAIHVLNTKRG